ncbi:MAG TPA: DUF58 domain-containing protein, partial [Flavobacterium sp.]|nr:DUF58 domain-containing protein [Flavobacterium sp.]
IYNTGESTRHIDWKLFAKTDRLYTKRYEEETNLRCHLILDNSSSMHYPKLKENNLFYQNKIGFSVLASAVLMNLLKKQRDAVGISIYSDCYEFFVTEKGSDKHHQMILNKLEDLITNYSSKKQTDTITYLHQIAKNIHRRSMIILFSDMFQNENDEDFFKALQHLKHNKHKVILFHVYDKKTELDFNYDNKPRKFIDIETGEEVNLFAENTKEEYYKKTMQHHKAIENTCLQYKIKYIPVSVGDGFEKIMTTYLIEKQKFG